ncbi:hypothetical protein GGR06_003094 [Bacteroides reticulotermitis]|uniref:Uncharacterized protein n=1 Tax=Bacteroides reticulotermitis TaxID=1133319 RepID=A0A840DA64_9BACE|nr:hypothetical protein [Bacteroides reticulotermitis]
MVHTVVVDMVRAAEVARGNAELYAKPSPDRKTVTIT